MFFKLASIQGFAVSFLYLMILVKKLGFADDYSFIYSLSTSSVFPHKLLIHATLFTKKIWGHYLTCYTQKNREVVEVV